MTPHSKDPRVIKFQMMMSQQESEAIEEWRWKNRISSKAEAIRLLVQKALEQEKK